MRQNLGGQLVSLAYGRSTGFAIDPIEKKPLNHFFPGTQVLSFGTAGCNLGCRFCQNWDISKARLADRALAQADAATGGRPRGRAGRPAWPSPTTTRSSGPSARSTSRKEAHARGLRTVFVTAGYVTERRAREIFAHMDAANVDLKAFTEDFYRKMTLSHLAPVLETLAWLARDKVWTEVTNLLIPGLNDARAETRALAEWVGEHIGAEVPLHFTAFHPDFKMMDRRPRRPRRSRARAPSRAEAASATSTPGTCATAAGQTTFCAACGDGRSSSATGMRFGATASATAGARRARRGSRAVSPRHR